MGETENLHESISLWKFHFNILENLHTNHLGDRSGDVKKLTQSASHGENTTCSGLYEDWVKKYQIISISSRSKKKKKDRRVSIAT